MTLFTDETELLLHPKTTNNKNKVVWARRREGVPPLDVKQGHTRINLQGRPDGAQVPRASEESKNLISTRYLARAIAVGRLYMMARPHTKHG